MNENQDGVTSFYLIGLAVHIFVASHKYVDIPDNEGYYPLYVGASRLDDSEPRRAGWCYDDEHEGNISDLNPLFCELTGFHFIWKQSPDDIVGLVHYRRFFGTKGDDGRYSPLDARAVSRLLAEYDCIVAEKSPVICGEYSISVAEQYRLTHCSTDLVQTRMVIADLCPDYLDAFDEVMFDTAFSPCNVLICKNDLFSNYCSWLFSIEFELYRRIDAESRKEAYQRRVFGFLSERLLNVYVRRHGLNAAECPVFDPAGSEVRGLLSYGKSHTPRPKVDNDALLIKSFKPFYRGRDYSPVFDLKFYLEHNPDVYDAFSDNPEAAFAHFLNCGVNEGRASSLHFSVKSYIRGNVHLQKRYGGSNALAYVEHYLNHPFDRRHAVGFENITVEEKTAAQSSGCIRGAVDALYRGRMLRKAERLGFID